MIFYDIAVFDLRLSKYFMSEGDIKRKEFTFIRETRTFPNFNFDEPTIIYSLENTSDLCVKVEFLHTVNCKIVVNNEIYYCSPQENKWFTSKSIIHNKEKIEIGFVACWAFPKTISLDSQAESWIYRYKIDLLSKRFWSNVVSTEIVNQGRRISFEQIRNRFNYKNIFKDNIPKKIKVILDKNIENEFLLIGLLLYLFEVELDNN